MEDWSMCVLQWEPRMSRSVYPKKKCNVEKIIGDLDLAVNKVKLREEEEDHTLWPKHSLLDLHCMQSTVRGMGYHMFPYRYTKIENCCSRVEEHFAVSEDICATSCDNSGCLLCYQTLTRRFLLFCIRAVIVQNCQFSMPYKIRHSFMLMTYQNF